MMHQDKDPSRTTTPQSTRTEIPLIPESIRVLWQGNVTLANTEVISVPSSLALNQETLERARSEFGRTMAPDQSDLPRLRFEGVLQNDDQLTVMVSPGISYGTHNILRHLKDAPENERINPTTMYALLFDRDDNVVCGVWKQDQSGKLAAAPVGFLDAPEAGGKTLANFTEEIRVKFEKQVQLGLTGNDAAEVQKALDSIRVRAVVSGVNHDTTILMFAKTNLSVTNIYLKGDKYSRMAAIPPKIELLEEMLRTGKYNVAEVNDLLLAGLAIYLKDLKAAV